MRVHNAIKELAAKKGIGHDEAEDILRASVARDPAAARAVAEIDRGRAEEMEAGRQRNRAMAGALGLTWEKAAALTELLADKPEVLTWLSKRVHLAIAHDRPLHDHE